MWTTKFSKIFLWRNILECIFPVAKFAYVHICLLQVLYSGMIIIFQHLRSSIEDGFALLPEWLTNKFQITRWEENRQYILEELNLLNMRVLKVHSKNDIKLFMFNCFRSSLVMVISSHFTRIDIYGLSHRVSLLPPIVCSATAFTHWYHTAQNAF